MTAVFSIGDVTVGPGEAGRGALTTFGLPGTRVNVPVIVLNGRREGPTLLLIAATHGREVSTIGALLDAVKLMKPSEMSGRVIAIPIANPSGVQLGSYINPYDDVDLSVAIALPPNPTGTVTQRLAVAIQEAIHVSDYVIDLHAHSFLSFPLILTARSMAPDEETRQEVVRFATSFGLPLVEQTRPGSRTYATGLGKPGICPELAGDHFMLESITRVGTRGILNCAKAIGILPGEPEAQESAIPGLSGELGLVLVRCTTGGFLRAHHAVGALLEEGDHIATIFDEYGDTLEEVRTPVAGYLGSWLPGYITQSWAVCEGTDVAYVVKPLDPGEEPPGEAVGDHPGMVL